MGGVEKRRQVCSAEMAVTIRPESILSPYASLGHGIAICIWKQTASCHALPKTIRDKPFQNLQHVIQNETF